jgi:hypothetical protein
MKQYRFLLLAGMVVAAAMTRVIPYLVDALGWESVNVQDVYADPWNFSPIAAICLFGGAHFFEKRWAFIVPLGAMVLSNVAIFCIKGETLYLFYREMPVVYGCFALTAWMGTWLQGRRSVGKIVGVALLSEAVFFLLTNLVDFFLYDGLYSRDLSVLVACYTAAIPFLKNSLLGMAFYGSVLFGTFALAEKRFPILRRCAVADVA